MNTPNVLFSSNGGISYIKVNMDSIKNFPLESLPQQSSMAAAPGMAISSPITVKEVPSGNQRKSNWLPQVLDGS